MTLRRSGALDFALLACFLACGVSFWSLYEIRGIDFRQDTLVSLLYCALPLLSLPAILLGLLSRKLVALQLLFALAYLAVYSTLNWRTCSALGYCGSLASTILLTLETPSVLAYFGMALLSFVALILRPRPKKSGQP